MSERKCKPCFQNYAFFCLVLLSLQKKPKPDPMKNRLFSALRPLAALVVCALCLAGCSSERTVKTANLEVTLSENGEIKTLCVDGRPQALGFAAQTRIEGAQITTLSSKKIKKGWEFLKEVAAPEGKATLKERFFATENSIRWELELLGGETPWTAPVQTVVHFPAAENTRFWTPWGRPGIDPEKVTDEALKTALQLSPQLEGWMDPLTAIPFTDKVYYYGGPRLTMQDPVVLYNPLMDEYPLTAIPLSVVIDAASGYGLSVALSPEDRPLDLDLTTSASGEMTFARYYHRIVESNPLLFALDLVAHEADWRPGFDWMTQRYAEFFNPENPELAFELNGTGAYSNHDVDFDADKMKAMAFATNWQASFDFPYMGMFLPPVPDDQTRWKRFGGDSTSIGWMREYASKMREAGFHVLNYFNVTEFGNYVDFPGKPVAVTDPAEQWKVCNDFLYGTLADAILLVPERMDMSQEPLWRSGNGTPYFSWEGCIAMDCGDPTYKAFLLEQARRHLDRIPEAYGFCIDRMDWTRIFNDRADDSVSWFEGPARSLQTSWKQLMDTLGPMVHQEGKVIFVNNHTKRLDQLRHVDGLFDEFTYNEIALNTTAFLTVRKPALGWTWDDKDIQKQGIDNFFQKYLYMGVYPMCPFPGNDHSIRPGELADKAYLDYGPLMRQMKHRRWVLTPNPVSVVEGWAKANLFAVDEGYLIPVVYASTPEVKLTIPGIDPTKTYRVEAYYPGQEEPEALQTLNPGDQTLQVPLHRGCAMVRLF